MAYEPTVWKSGDTVTSAKLNKMEQGIANAGGGVLIVGINVPTMTLDKTWQEIVDASFAVIAMTASGATNYAYLISTQHQSDFSYEVNAFLIQNGALSPTKFVATSADGYPAMSN